MTERKPGGADNAVVDEPLFETHDAAGHLELPPYTGWLHYTAGSDGEPPCVGVARVHAAPRSSGVRLALSVEDSETGFDVGASATFGADEALELAAAIVRTAEACR